MNLVRQALALFLFLNLASPLMSCAGGEREASGCCEGKACCCCGTSFDEEDRDTDSGDSCFCQDRSPRKSEEPGSLPALNGSDPVPACSAAGDRKEPDKRCVFLPDRMFATDSDGSPPRLRLALQQRFLI